MVGEAYRRRTELIGALGVCDCSYPLERALTSTEHVETCPAHLILENLVTLEELVAYVEETSPEAVRLRVQEETLRCLLKSAVELFHATNPDVPTANKAHVEALVRAALVHVASLDDIGRRRLLR